MTIYEYEIEYEEETGKSPNDMEYYERKYSESFCFWLKEKIDGLEGYLEEAYKEIEDLKNDYHE